MISVYITTRNRRELLERAVISVLNQTKSAKEIIIVDDASSDDTKNFIDNLCLFYPSIIYIRNTSCLGAQASRNKAIAVSTQQFITGLDDDDEFQPNRLQKLYEALISEPNLSFVCDHIEIDTGKGKIYPNTYVGYIDIKKVLDFNIVGPQIFTTKQNLLDINGFDTKFPAWQDYDTWVRLIEKFGPCKKLNGVSYTQHTAHDKTRISSSGKHDIAFNLFIKKHEDLISKGNMLSLIALKKMLSKEKSSLLIISKLILVGKFKRALSVIKSNMILGKRI